MISDIRKQTIGYIVSAFGIVAGLAWNDAIKGFIEYLFPLGTNGLWAKFLYALIVTFVVVLVTAYLLKLAGKEEPKK